MEVVLPVLHKDQLNAWNTPGRYIAIRCGRRWGKTTMGACIAEDGAIKKESIGWFAPSYRLLMEAYVDILEVLKPVVFQQSKPVVIRTISGGRIDFWSLENIDAGRSRRYHKVIIDEAAFTKENMIDIWRKAIRPTLFDYSGMAIVLSNTKGADPDNFLWKICNEPEHGFIEYHAPTHNNPLLPLKLADETMEEWEKRREEEFVKIKSENHPLVYAQEYLAEFVDWSGVAFFSKEKLLVNDNPLPDNERVDMVYAVIDTAIKTGQENDGTAVMYFGLNKLSPHPLRILDWDIIQIEGALLETWLPTVFQNLESLSKMLRARRGSAGVHIEDKTSGTILIQQAQRRSLPAFPIESQLTAMGKDERAISVSGYVHRGLVKFAKSAYDKTVTYKNVSRNHALHQILSFRVGDKEHTKRPDDLLDTFCYGIAIGLGNIEGF